MSAKYLGSGWWYMSDVAAKYACNGKLPKTGMAKSIETEGHGVQWLERRQFMWSDSPEARSRYGKRGWVWAYHAPVSFTVAERAEALKKLELAESKG